MPLGRWPRAAGGGRSPTWLGSVDPCMRSARATARACPDPRDSWQHRGTQRTTGMPTVTFRGLGASRPARDRCLDVDDGRVVRESASRTATPVIPMELAAVYDAENGRDLSRRDHVVVRKSHHAGGGAPHRRAGVHPADGGRWVRTVATHVGPLLRAGADKVAANTAAIACPDLLADMARQFGSGASCCPSTRAQFRWDQPRHRRVGRITTHGGRRGTGMDAVQWAARGADLGVGRSCSTRWTPTAPKPVRPGFAACGPCRGHGAGNRQRAPVLWSTSRQRLPAWGRCSGSQRLSLQG